MRRFVALMLAVLVGCGGPSGVVEIPAEDLPFDVARGGTQTPGGRPSTYTIYLERDGRLVSAERAVRSGDPPLEGAVRALLAGPTRTERSRGIGSQLPPTARLISIESEGDVATIAMSRELQEPAEPLVVLLRVAQIVWTVTEIPTIRRVRFLIEGEPAAVPVPGRGTVDRPVGRGDYASVAPR